MPEPHIEDRARAAETGFFGHTAGFLSGSMEYLKLRLELAGMEAKEAAGHYAVVVGLLLAALVVVVFGYIFFCLALVFAIAALFRAHHHAWIWITFAVALLHFGAAIGALLLARAKFSAGAFTETLNEFKKDQEWLNSTTAREI